MGNPWLCAVATISRSKARRWAMERRSQPNNHQIQIWVSSRTFTAGHQKPGRRARNLPVPSPTLRIPAISPKAAGLAKARHSAILMGTFACQPHPQQRCTADHPGQHGLDRVVRVPAAWAASRADRGSAGMAWLRRSIPIEHHLAGGGGLSLEERQAILSSDALSPHHMWCAPQGKTMHCCAGPPASERHFLQH